MLAIAYPLLAAATFAFSSVIMKRLTEYGSAIKLNAFRSGVGALLFLIHLLIIGEYPSLMGLDYLIIAMLVLSVLFNIVLGDTSYFGSQEIISVKVATPIVNTYPFFTVLLAFFILGEPITGMYLFGTLVIVTGIILLSQKDKEEEDTHGNRMVGFVLAFMAIVFYAGGVITITMASVNVDAIVANSVRMPAATLLLTFMT
ncbi:MAG: DMT family transporter [Candidatus Heimdallarchaeota archaeon]|nr:DMT family transporter [Candidatus Heimdallarchaeota archaeon]